MSVSAQEFKEGLARWTSGVTVVTSRSGARMHGMTVSAFASVSLHPPLVLVCADKASDTHALIGASGVFAANVLARGQEEISDRFAWGDERTRFDGLEWHPAKTGSPLLEGALAGIDCRVVATHDAGDHVIYVGEVVAVEAGEGDPLVYFAGRYRAIEGERRGRGRW